MSGNQKWIHVAALLFLLGFILFYHFYGYFGHYGFDDIHYARLAKRMADGVFETTNDHYTFRWGIIGLNAVAYYFFGVNDQSSALFPMAAFFLSLLTVFLLLKNRPFAERYFAISFLGLSQWVIFYSDKIMPDILIMFCVLLGVTVLYSYYFGAFSRRPGWAGWLLASVLLLGFVCKETIVLVLPLLAFLMIRDLVQRRHIRFWLWAGLGVLALFGLYFFYLYRLSGDPFFRFNAIRINAYFNECSYDQLPISHMVRRVGYQLMVLFIKSGLFAGFIFIFAGFFAKNPKSKPESFFALSAIFLLLSANFMTTSYQSYSPLCLDPRHYLFLAPVAALAGAPRVYHFIFGESGKTEKWWIIVLSASALAVAWYNGSFSKYLYMGILLLGVQRLAWSAKGTKGYPTLYYGMLIALLYILPGRAIRDARRSNYPIQQQLILREFKHKEHRNTIVLTDPVQMNYGQYYLEFDSTRVKFIDLDELSVEAAEAADEIYLLLNGYTRYLANWDWDRLPAYAKTVDETHTLVFKGEGILFYRLDKAVFVDALMENGCLKSTNQRINKSTTTTSPE